MGHTLLRIEAQGLVYYQFAALCGQGGVAHALFTRLGGVSLPPYASLNVGASVGDDPQAVNENRRRMYAAFGLREDQVVSPHQVHSTIVAQVGRADGGRLLPATDGLVTAERGVALFLRFADCTPILLYDAQRQAVGLVHAGWRGTLEGIAAEGVAALARHFGSRPQDLWAGIGPCIGPCCYEVDAALGRAFSERLGAGVVRPGRERHFQLDLAGANEAILRQAGVSRVEQARLCTACHVDEFFSHRREGGHTGRLGVLLGLL